MGNLLVVVFSTPINRRPMFINVAALYYYKKAAIPMTRQELLKLMGVLILLTRLEFAASTHLWSNNPPSPYEFPA
jgi:hypothetical protein